ncbi:MAG: tRNA (adenosine(37)-N6)-threonylcarbamoyltransferase complex dimerization subunit type 1 TsaB [Dehalococcoidales bacterium]|nr:tRNA (adenosine(37)-N6)-threonylcarbamoyltransferase complex dimerization subunit type 1 TsaB [Dehalococcoidales bacterium]
MQISIDTSTDFASLALVNGFEILAELNWRCGQNHTIELTSRLEFLIKKSMLEINDADCIFVARGPGSFNGLRVGVSTAKGLAFSLGIPIIGISTLESTAYQHAAAGLPVCAVQNAGREEIAAAVYQQQPRKGWRQLAAEHITTLDGLVSEINDRTIFCGEINAATSARIKTLFKTRAVIPPAAAQLRRGAYLAELCRRRQEAGDYDNTATLQPIYLRRPPITERKKSY